MLREAPATLRAGVLVIGAGLAGLAAAIEARLAGASVLVLDAAPPERLGGNARHGRNLRCANGAETPFQRDTYQSAEFVAELVQSGAPDPALAEALAAGSEDIADWLLAQGVRLEPWAEGNLPYSRRTVFLRGGGQAMVNALLRRARSLGVVIRSGHRLSALDPALLGVEALGPFLIVAQTTEGEVEIEADAVVLACGGTGAEPVTQSANRGTPEQLGEPLLWALNAGAMAAGTPDDGHRVAVDARAGRQDAGIVSRVDGMHLGLVVGADGRRFYDEGAVTNPARHSVLARALSARSDPRGWIVLGAETVKSLPPLLFRPISADTPEALAHACGIDPSGLEQTLSLDIDPPHTGVVDLSLPLQAIPVIVGQSFSRFGLAVDTSARVKLASGARAARFFAAGTTMCGAVLGEGYLSGAGLTIAAVFGRLAGRAAAHLAREETPKAQGAPPPPPPVYQRAEHPSIEAQSALNICNTCGYCSGLCSVFLAAQWRAALTQGDLRHLAHLCHDCGSCADDCQYAPPHALQVNIPATLAELRRAEYPGEARASVWLFLALTLVLPLAGLIFVPWAQLFRPQHGPGVFYRVLPHAGLATGAGLVFGFALLALLVRMARYWRAIRAGRPPVGPGAVLSGLRNALSLHNLADCEDRNGPTGQGRRLAHHLLAGGFLLTFLATLAGFIMHLLGEGTPYASLSPPVLLGASGGASMLAGLVYLSISGLRRDRGGASRAMERANVFARFQLAFLAVSGLALLTLRETAAMQLLLMLHLGAVAGFALLLPFGKFAHPGLRLLALISHAVDKAHKAGG